MPLNRRFKNFKGGNEMTDEQQVKLDELRQRYLELEKMNNSRQKLHGKTQILIEYEKLVKEIENS